MGVKLVSASAGSVEIVAPATASNYTATMPAGSGTVAVNGVSGTLVSGTAVASTSGTSIDFTGIPSWVKRITVMLQGVSTNGTSTIQVQIGSGSVTTTGYLGAGCFVQNASTTGASTLTSGFVLSMNVAAVTVIHGIASIALLNSSTNLWAFSANVARSDTASVISGAGSIALAGVLDRVRITTVNGTDAFDAGSINILYE